MEFEFIVMLDPRTCSCRLGMSCMSSPVIAL